MESVYKGEPMGQTLALIHTVSKLVPIFEDLCDELLPGVDRFHIADEAALRLLLAAGGITPELCSRLAEHAIQAEAAGAHAILLTCSSSSPCVDVARERVPVPVLKIDEPMIDRAIAMGSRIGIAATAVTTVEPTTELIASRAAIVGQEVQVQVALSREAHGAMLSGNMDRHDQLVRDGLLRLMETSDVVLLAQVSMARVAGQIPEGDRAVPILSSPVYALERVAELLVRTEPRTQHLRRRVS